jgi:hypothetical protein
LLVNDDSAHFGIDLGTPQGITKLFQRVTRGQLLQSLRSIDAKIAKGMRKEDAW